MPRSHKRIGNIKGQTLVELAFVIPGFCLAVFAIVRLVVFCWNQVEFQRMAQVAGNDATHSTPDGYRPYHWGNKSWGMRFPSVTRHYTSTPVTRAQAYRGISTTSLPLRLMHIEITGPNKQKSSIMTLIEPPIPGQRP